MNDSRSGYSWRNVLLGGLVVVLAIAVVAWVFFPSIAPTDTVPYSVYFPGQANVEEGTKVVFNRRAIGKVTAVRQAEVGMQLTVFPDRVPELPEVATLLRGTRITVRPGLEVTLAGALENAAMRWNGVDIAAFRTAPGEWTLTAAGPVLGMSRNGVPVLTNAGESVAVSPGDQLGFTSGGRTFQLYWGDVGYLTRAELAVERATFLELAEKAGVRDTALDRVIGAGSSIALLSGFGRPRPELELRPSLLADPAAIATFPVDTTAAGDPVARELAPAASLDPLATVATLASYLASPIALRQEPTNRFEKAVADANRTLASFAELSEQFNRAGQGSEPQGVLTRLALDQANQRNLAVALGSASNLRAASARLNAIAGTVDAGIRDTTARGRLLHQLLDGGYVSLEASLANAAAISARVGRPDSSLLSNVAGPDADLLLRNATRLSVQLSNDSIPLLQRVAGDSITRNIDSLTANFDAIAQRARKPGLLALLAMIGAVTLNNIVGIVR